MAAKDRLIAGAAMGALAVIAAGLCPMQEARAYIGEAYLTVPGVTGHAGGTEHRGTVQTNSHEWVGQGRVTNSGARRGAAAGGAGVISGGAGGAGVTNTKFLFGGPNAPQPGHAGQLNVSLAKDNPDLAALMQMCTSHASLPTLRFREISDLARPILEFGQRPANIPDHWDYEFQNVQITDCPVVEGAAEQALAISFQDIRWLNYDPAAPMANRIDVSARDFPNVHPTIPSNPSSVRSWVITWFAPASLVAEDQCTALNDGPTDADYYRYLSPEQAARTRAAAGERGITAGPQSEVRGPDGMNVVTMPGIVPPPTHNEPTSNIAFGMNLDGREGGPGSRDYTSPDGRTGIDNAYYTVMGCVPGYRGRNGYRNQTSNARRADGNITTLIEVRGIDDMQNDRRVEVAFIYSMDKPVRDVAGHVFLPNYTFRASSDAQFAMFNVRVRGRIENGVIITDETPMIEINLGQDPLVYLHNAQMRLSPQPDGSLHGNLGGYVDWRRLLAATMSGSSEGLFNYQQPGLYDSFRRNADGLYNADTGTYDGVSTAYEIDAVAAFMSPAPQQVAQAEAPAARN